MDLRKLIFTENECYKVGAKMTPIGIVVHSTGANNPELRRYIGPDDGIIGKNLYNNHWNQPMNRRVCVHGFIGKDKSGKVRTYRTPDERALDRMLMAAADKLDNETLLQLAPVWVKGEPLEAGMIRQHDGEIVTITKNMIAGLELEKTAEKPKEETEGG